MLKPEIRDAKCVSNEMICQNKELAENSCNSDVQIRGTAAARVLESDAICSLNSVLCAVIQCKYDAPQQSTHVCRAIMHAKLI